MSTDAEGILANTIASDDLQLSISPSSSPPTPTPPHSPPSSPRSLSTSSTSPFSPLSLLRSLVDRLPSYHPPNARLAVVLRRLTRPHTLLHLAVLELLYHLILLPLVLFLLSQGDLHVCPFPLYVACLSFLLLRSLALLGLHALRVSPARYYASARRTRLLLRAGSTLLAHLVVISADWGRAIDALMAGGDVRPAAAVVLVMAELAVWYCQWFLFVALVTCHKPSTLSVLPPFVPLGRGESGSEEGGEAEEEREREEEAIAAALKGIRPLAYHAGMKCDAHCAICVADMEAGEAVRLFTCGHGFHAHCIDAWLLVRQVCPLCVSVVNLHIRSPRPTVELTVMSA